MSDLKDLLERIHERSVWQVLGIYLAGGWVVLQVIDTLQQESVVPASAFRLALALLLIGLPIVTVTTYVQKGLRTQARAERRGIGRVFTWRNALGSGVFAFALWGMVSAAWLLTQGSAPAVPKDPPALEGVAFLPFQAEGTGEAAAAWGEGLSALLATDLDGVGGLRKVDPRSVLAIWRRELNGAANRQTLLDVARRTGAAYAVAGSVVEVADQLILSAQVFGVASGEETGPAVRVNGSPDSVLVLVDRLSTEILRAGLLPLRAGQPAFDLSRATTGSIDALKAFVDGEYDYRRARFRDAIGKYDRAVEIDSTFPLALFRLAIAHAMEDNEPDLALEYGRRALALADRLPARERMLIEGFIATAEGRDDAMAILSELTKRYPDDVEAWYLLGDAYFNVGVPHLQPRRRFQEAMREAIRRNPYFGPPYAEYLDNAFYDRDSATIVDYVRQYAKVDHDTDWCVGVQVAADVGYGSPQARSRMIEGLDTIPPDALVCAQFALQFSPATWDDYSEVWAAQTRRPSYRPPVRPDARIPRVNAVAQRGRFREAVGWIEDMYRGSPPAGEMRDALWWYVAGYHDPRVREWADALARADDASPTGDFLLAVLAADEKRWTDADARVAALRTRADSLGRPGERAETDPAMAAQVRGLAVAAVAAVEMRRRPNDPGAVDRAIRALLRMPTTSRIATTILRYDIGRELVDAGRFTDARPYFESFTAYDPPFHTPVEYWLGRVDEGTGQLDSAGAHYARFVSWWQEADPQFRAWHDEARGRLERLVRERSQSP